MVVSMRGTLVTSVTLKTKKSSSAQLYPVQVREGHLYSIKEPKQQASTTIVTGT